MTALLERAFAEAAKLPATEQDSIAAKLLAEMRSRAPNAEAPGWPAGFFEKTFGSIDDETFFRHPQGEYEKRLELE
jgi:hypothetical protein